MKRVPSEDKQLFLEESQLVLLQREATADPSMNRPIKQERSLGKVCSLLKLPWALNPCGTRSELSAFQLLGKDQTLEPHGHAGRPNMVQCLGGKYGRLVF